MDYIKNTFSNLAKQVGGSASTKQSDLFWTYSAGGIPLVTYGLLAATTLVLAASTLSMSGGAKTSDNKEASDAAPAGNPPANETAAAPEVKQPEPVPEPAPAGNPQANEPAPEPAPAGQGGKRKKGKSSKNKKSKKSKTTKRRK
jgi:hypothetical protein